MPYPHLINRRVTARRLPVPSLGALTLGVLAAAACATASTAASTAAADSALKSKPAPVAATIEVYPQTYTSWLAVLAQAGGFFARNGIKAKIVSVAGGGPVAMDALANGSADIAMADMSITGPLLDKGVGLEVVSGAAAADWDLVGPTSSTIKYPNDVKQFNGKTVGVIVVGGSGYYYMKALAGVAKINVTYSAFGAPVANAVAAMTSHSVDGAVVNPDVANYLVRSHQAKILYDFSDPANLGASGPPLSSLAGQPNDWMVATTAWARKHPAAVQRYQLAMDEAEVWVQDPTNLGKVISLLKRTDQLPSYDSGAIARKAVSALLPSLVAYLPSTTPAAYQQFWIKVGLLTKTIPTKRWVSSTMPASEAQVEAAVGKAESGS